MTNSSNYSSYCNKIRLIIFFTSRDCDDTVLFSQIFLCPRNKHIACYLLHSLVAYFMDKSSLGSKSENGNMRNKALNI